MRTARYRAILLIGAFSASISTVAAHYQSVSTKGEGRRGRRKGRTWKSGTALLRHLDMLLPSLAARRTHVTSASSTTSHLHGEKKPRRYRRGFSTAQREENKFNLYGLIRAICTSLTRYRYANRWLPGGTIEISRRRSISTVGNRFRPSMVD
ncbi:hypothetical protein GW17_00031238 [Ensete ventricosum]|nr:hypothetical protein GW17_00031238 [Ensete ventricosum]